MNRVHVPPDSPFWAASSVRAITRIMGRSYLTVAHALPRGRHGQPPSAYQETADAHKARPPPAARKSG
jgi:hypothetical protein